MATGDQFLARTVVHLPFTEKRFNPGDVITQADLDEARQTPEDVETLLASGIISNNLDDDIEDAHKPVKPSAPTVHGVVGQAQFLVQQMEERGETVPDELRAVSELALEHKIADQKGAGNDSAR